MVLADLFAPLLGNWTGVEEQSASPWAPAASARAMLVFKLDVGASIVVQDYRQVRSDGAEFAGHGVFLAGTAGVSWWFFDSYGQPPEPANGGFTDGDLVLEKVTPRGTARHVFGLVEEDLGYRIDVRHADSDEYAPFLRGRYRRISGH